MTTHEKRTAGLAILESEHLIAPISPQNTKLSSVDTKLSYGARQPISRPSSGGELSRVLGILSGHGMSCLVRGGGSRLGIGNPLGAIDVVLETGGLSGVTEFEREDGVVEVGGGTPLAVLREQVAAEGWELRLDPAGDAATVGGTLAAAAIGPRSLGFGRPRDCVLGLEVTLASGEQTRCGGRVVKNVTGYDMAKLYTGSFGTLGVIASAWLKLAPIPEMKQILTASSASFENMFAISLEASRRTTARAAALISPAAARTGEVSVSGRRDHWVLALELAGDEPAVRADAQWLHDRSTRTSRAAEGSQLEALPPSDPTGPRAPSASRDHAGHLPLSNAAATIEVAELVESPALSGSQLRVIDRLRNLQGGAVGRSGVRARIAAVPSKLPAVVGGVAPSCPAVILYPGMGLLYGFSRRGTDGERAALAACERTAMRVGGSLMLEALPDAVRDDRDVFGDLGPELALMRSLKQRFDPTGVLNPGRFAGGI